MGNIVHLSEAASIAIHSLVLIAKAEQQVNVQYISDETGSSKHHVAKVLQRMAKAGFIISTRGPHGGFSLNMAPGAIYLLDVYEAIEGKMEIPQCLADHRICPFNKCLLDDVAQKMTVQFRNYLKGQTIQSYLD